MLFLLLLLPTGADVRGIVESLLSDGWWMGLGLDGLVSGVEEGALLFLRHRVVGQAGRYP